MADEPARQPRHPDCDGRRDRQAMRRRRPCRPARAQACRASVVVWDRETDEIVIVPPEQIVVPDEFVDDEPDVDREPIRHPTRSRCSASP